MAHQLTAGQLQQLETTERVASCFSLLGTSFIFCTFIYSSEFRKPVNRLIFYASWGNMLCNIATLMSQSGIRAGRDSPLCQFQGFLIQMFLPADALWNLALAINVYLTLFRKYNAQQLKSMEWKYHIMCYGCPFIVAFVYIFIRSHSRGHIYGPATLWCWIDIKWVVLRIALCYVPAWIAIIVSFCIYLLAGHEIFAKRKQLRVFSHPPCQMAPIENPFTDYKTTEVQITRETIGMSELPFPKPVDPAAHCSVSGSTVSSPPSSAYTSYTVSIGSAPIPPRTDMSPTASKGAMQHRANRAALEANAAAFGYTKVALLFFVSLLVTWVPSSVNRVYSLIHPDLVSLPFTFASGVVLPLMGFWNSVIYITTSWQAVYMLFTGNLQGGTSKRPSLTLSRPSMGSRKQASRESDSLKGFADAKEEHGYRMV